jgi:hypothetical protein
MKIAIGIDTGVNTGFAIWDIDNKEFLSIKTYTIHIAMAALLNADEMFEIKEVRVEDARLWKYGHYGVKSNPDKLQGVGAVKRDAKIWEDFLTDYNIPFKLVRPNKNITKWTAKKFKTHTKCELKTNEHNRDAAMLVYNL